MKRIIFVCLFTLALFSCLDDSTRKSRIVAAKAQEKMAQTAISAIEIPQVSYFQERRTIAKWAQRWDKPSIPTYIYLISYGRILGYYVADGKPASTRSYLMPEDYLADSNEGEGATTLSAPDIDGTYGDNNPGIRFFTAEGVAVEWGGDGASYLYSDAPLPFDVPRLNSK